MTIPIHKVFSGKYNALKSHQPSLKTSHPSLAVQQPSEINTLRKESINSLTKSLLQRDSQQNNVQTYQNAQFKDPRITNLINAGQNITSLPKSNQIAQRNSQMQKLQQLKSRFKKIKNSYEQTHKLINSNIANCLQNYKERCTQKEGDQNVNVFEIMNEDLTFSQSRQLNGDESMNLHENNREISFRHQTNPMEHITVNAYENKQNYRSSANQSLSHSYNQGKYKSLSKQLQNMRHNELVQLLIDQIEENQKNKQVIIQQTQVINSMKKQADERYSQVPKLKNQIQNKNNELQSKRQQIAIILQTQRKNLQIIQKLKKQLQYSSKIDQKSLSFEHSQIHKTSAVRKDICINTSQDSSKIFIQKQDDSVDYKVKHDQLKKYMNEYITNVNQAHEQYKNNLKQLKQTNHALKQQNISMTQEIHQSRNTKTLLQNQLLKLSKDAQKLSHALSNSKQFIKQLQEEFLILKQENSQMKSILQTQGAQFIEMKNHKQSMINEIDDLLIYNQALYHRNELLNEEIAQIQSRMLANSQIQTQVRAMISGLTQQRTTLQQQLQQQTQENQKLTQANEKLTKQLNYSQQAISATKQTESQLEQKIKTLQTKLKTLSQTITQLNVKSSMLQEQNIILQETNQEMQKLQQELLYEYESQKDEKLKLRSELVQIMNHVNQMQTIYVNELSSNQLIKNELSKFWQNQSNRPSNLSANHYTQSNNPKQDKARTHTNSGNPSGHLKSHNSVENMSNSEVSFKKNSQMTKQGSGSSSVFRHNINSDELCINSKVSDQQNNGINASSIVDGSRISERYYSETDEDVHQQLQILKSSKKVNNNVSNDNIQGKIRLNGRVGSIKDKENR